MLINRNIAKTTLGVVMLSVSSIISNISYAEEEFGSFFDVPSQPPTGQAAPAAVVHKPCTGSVRSVNDVAFEGVKTTSYNWISIGGGGEGGRYDKTPVLSTKLKLSSGCLNAHLSAMVGGATSYGSSYSSLTMFQVTLSRFSASGLLGSPIHMVGHYETPYGIYSPAVAMSAEHDVDMLSANFYQNIGHKPYLAGMYQVDVWWAGGPVGGGGAIGADFVLKLYQY
ncbi:exported hypothetical protein [Crenothrix polyspora]|uniref:Uncharacterized protein n=1 Tax=Crenothrix polyspora TaxID=360316 RepID=A0A1R4H872_9GAMM|nr:hypothetical protein [Crenothrix polyspora]SJM92409.1 exported hypothetical protein [Crenothrix polyspora]